MIYHITATHSWPPAGPTLEPDSLATDGFVHCSYWAQLPTVVNTIFERGSDLIVLEIDEELVSDPIKVEDLYDCGECYPHIYGPVPIDAVTGVLRIRWPETGPVFIRVDHSSAAAAAGDAAALPNDPPAVDSLACSIVAPTSDARTADDTVALLARLNEQLITDEGHDNPMNREQLATRMKEFLDGSYRAYLFTARTGAGGPVDGLVAGYALIDHDQRPPYLRQFYIQRGLRRGGLGRRAFKLLLETAQLDDVRLEVLTSNERAVRFWHSVGFKDRSLEMVRPGSRRPEGVESTAGGASGEHAPIDLNLKTIVGDVGRERSFILEGLQTYNDSVSPYHRAAREEGGVTGVAVMLTDGKGRWLGGVVGESYWDWLEVNDLWISEEARGRGYGRQLLATIEEIARNRGARHSALNTFSFQARGFYEKYGYRVIGESTDYPPGESLYWLRKELT